ncbi:MULTISPECIES: LPXTG cell wall anchor domain-containing protein [Glycomyces]|uniref:LPXTG cell wall anchor domain-containing protein n=2 Tax=Glycomyces TaxID=58113 RepID=A0A9X3T095_9ACTN|nr:LPXTG cell wall anchor domain-containing protein [Glycomyces lechevalierae]MDA1388321.1 LPXTG cell wall anchor domain-containing protein [Glycomyces lechevalierae]MDR7338724.1 LPXTG-motif cell wall-anchored protein [Glycomyces lechevalierae]
MSTLNKTGLRIAAAGAAAALTLAVGAPAFAQNDGETTEEATTPAAETTETPAAETTETPTPGATEEAPAEENPGENSEVVEDKDPNLEEVPETEVPDEELPELGEEDEEDFGSFYSYIYVDEVLQNADNGETVEAHPEFYIEEAPENPEDVAATVLVFNDSTSLESIENGEEWELTYHAWAYAPYDNCNVWEWGVTCVVTGFEGESDTTYGLDGPLYFDIIDEVDDNDAAPYYAVDVDDATLDEILAEGVYDLESDNQLGLTEIEPTEGDWWYGFGTFYFEAGQALPDVPTADQPGTGGGQLPTTGNSSIILISSAAAALLAGAVVFFMLRRRKTAGTWE